MHHDGGVLWLAGVHRDTATLLEKSGSTIPWVAEEPVPGLSVRRCIERLRDRPPEQGRRNDEA
jgi:hypothetical protein